MVQLVQLVSQASQERVDSVAFQVHLVTQDIQIVLWIDRFFAVSNFMYFTVYSTMHVTVYSPIFSLFMAWLYSYRLLKKSIELHALFHILAVLGAHAYLWYS